MLRFVAVPFPLPIPILRILKILCLIRYSLSLPLIPILFPYLQSPSRSPVLGQISSITRLDLIRPRLHLIPNSDRSHPLLGQISSALGQISSALGQISSAVRSQPHSTRPRPHSYPHSARSHQVLGQISSALGQISSPLGKISSSTRLDPIHFSARSYPLLS